MIAKTPDPPYYAVIFTSLKSADDEGYAVMAQQMEELASAQPGYLGFESARGETAISVSYWEDLESVRKWKKNLEHQEAQRMGREKWYSKYQVRIAKVERAYGFES